MKKIALFFVIFLVICSSYVLAGDADISGFLSDIKNYESELMPELKNENILESIKDGKISLSNSNVFEKIINVFLRELKSNIFLVFQIIGVSIFCSILKNMQNSFGENSVSEIAFYVCYILVIILIVNTFVNVMSECRTTINDLSEFMSIILPLIIGLMLVNGNIMTASTLQPVLLMMISAITFLINNFIIPILLISMIITIISNISNKINVKQLGNLLKKISLWIIEVVLIIFFGLLSLEGTLASSIDGITAKTAKSVISNSVPVVGKLLGDAVDSVLGGTVITKNAIGTIGIIIIITITVIPIIKTLILMLIFNLTGALMEPIADTRICKCMSATGDNIKALFGVMVTVTFLFIIAITLIIKLSNFSIMYR